MPAWGKRAPQRKKVWIKFKQPGSNFLGHFIWRRNSQDMFSWSTPKMGYPVQDSQLLFEVNQNTLCLQNVFWSKKWSPLVNPVMLDKMEYVKLGLGLPFTLPVVTIWVQLGVFSALLAALNPVWHWFQHQWMSCPLTCMLSYNNGFHDGSWDGQTCQSTPPGREWYLLSCWNLPRKICL